MWFPGTTTQAVLTAVNNSLATLSDFVILKPNGTQWDLSYSLNKWNYSSIRGFGTYLTGRPRLWTHLSEDPAQEVVVPGEGVSHQHLGGGAGVQQPLIGGLEEALVGVEAWLEELVEELAEDAAAIDAGLVQAVSVQQVDSDPLLQVRLWRSPQRREKQSYTTVTYPDQLLTNTPQTLPLRLAGFWESISQMRLGPHGGS